MSIDNQNIVFAPASLEQQNFLTTEVDFAFYGGGFSASV